LEEWGEEKISFRYEVSRLRSLILLIKTNMNVKTLGKKKKKLKVFPVKKEVKDIPVTGSGDP
jgi:hypothetical protein